MPQHSERQGQLEKCCSRDQNEHGSDGEYEVLADHGRGALRQATGCRQSLHIFREQRHIGCLKGNV